MSDESREKQDIFMCLTSLLMLTIFADSRTEANG